MGSMNVPPPRKKTNIRSGRWTSSPEDLLEFAHLVIANAMNVGDPPVDPVPGWHAAARWWMDLYHEHLDRGRQ